MQSAWSFLDNWREYISPNVRLGPEVPRTTVTSFKNLRNVDVEVDRSCSVLHCTVCGLGDYWTPGSWCRLTDTATYKGLQPNTIIFNIARSFINPSWSMREMKIERTKDTIWLTQCSFYGHCSNLLTSSSLIGLMARALRLFKYSIDPPAEGISPGSDGRGSLRLALDNPCFFESGKVLGGTLVDTVSMSSVQ